MTSNLDFVKKVKMLESGLLSSLPRQRGRGRLSAPHELVKFDDGGLIFESKISRRKFCPQSHTRDLWSEQYATS